MVSISDGRFDIAGPRNVGGAEFMRQEISRRGVVKTTLAAFDRMPRVNADQPKPVMSVDAI
jgi:hypothetical protein